MITAMPTVPVTAAADWPVGLVETGPEGEFRAANPAGLAMLAQLGFEAGGLVFGSLGRAMPDIALRVRLMTRGASLKRSLRTPRGERIGLWITRTGLGFTLLLTDETELARAEDEAHRQRARFAALADSLSGGAVYALDRDGLVTGWSASAERLEGLSPGEAVGLSFDLLLARAHLGVDAAALLAEAARCGAASVTLDRTGQARGLMRVVLEVRAVRTAEGVLDGFVVSTREQPTATGREAELRRLAETDPLTGVLNRRAFDEAASVACALARANHQPFAVVAFDLDAFKALNDRYGHAGGDAALKALAEAASRDVRAGDLIGRLGGDEFAIALPRADAALATRIAERLRRTVAGLSPRHGRRVLRFTASFGVASADDPAESFADTVARADAALYRAKNAGRDRVATA
jgi:diguanylate cyclase (GGDEF)-like protein